LAAGESEIAFAGYCEPINPLSMRA